MKLSDYQMNKELSIALRCVVLPTNGSGGFMEWFSDYKDMYAGVE
ncbi:MAG: hypothetical protein OXC44_02045 [Proteobacteria bacterium]|nr:hypothetical protein [Pseudomonadota bacterium]